MADSDKPAEPSLLVVHRDFDSPAERIFDAWFDPASVGQWLFATPGGQMSRIAIDGRVGGGFAIDEQRGRELARHWGTYLQIDRPRKLVFDLATSHAEQPTRLTLDIAPRSAGGCQATLTHQLDAKWISFGNLVRQGWTSILDGLAAAAPSPREFVIMRTFDAGRQLLFKAWTDPKHMSRWWGPHHFTNPVCDLDPRPGGRWRIAMRAPDAAMHPATGIYREVSPRRLVMTIDHSGLPDDWHDRVNPTRDKSKGKPAMEAELSVTFDEFNGKTMMRIIVRLETAEIRDALLKIGMNQGWSQSLDRLAEEVATMQECRR